jgi:tRNA (mo5U34)-methyltransferase
MTVEDQRADPFAGVRTWRNKFYSKGWWHSFELPDGTRIDGVNAISGLQQRISKFPIPEDLRGKRVLDIGAWDGWFSFEMERRGAEVLAIDNWDNPRFHEVRGLLKSRVEYRQMDVYDLTPKTVGRFDIVLFMGVLYHLKHPLLALERVCALTTGMAAVDSFVLREQHVPGFDLDTVPIMAYYETDEFAGQTDNWVGPSLACLMAFCRTAGFARVELQGMFDYGACIACYRRWEPPSLTASAAPHLSDVFHNKNGGINFESDRDTYLSAFFDSPVVDLTRDNVQPEVGGYGVRPLNVWQCGAEHWQVDFMLPPGLTPGWHDVSVRVKDSRPGNALRIAVDLPLVPGPIEIAGLRDGATWAANEIDLAQGAVLSLWIAGLPENADRNNIRVYLADIRLEVLYIEPAQLNQPRQVNAILPLDIESGLAPAVAIVGNERSAPVQIQITGTPTTSR